MEGKVFLQFQQPNVHIWSSTTLPRSSARRSGESTFSQMSFVSSGATPRSGRGPASGLAEGGKDAFAAHPSNKKESHPSTKRFTIYLLDGVILKKLPYEKLTE